ncbi:Type IV secretory protein VirB4 component [Legionella gratiana]|uniref:Type IV secretory protein VirB4 component n=1 Tax=Legionella gratiana TaxID=45066 RepID=A0A378JDP0_9GAMM|nr:Type IV secretory protein VirB4 component [Legionella gratiana]STX45158.1 Type IV secretory protein VirB4 component [Legionella gratiana]
MVSLLPSPSRALLDTLPEGSIYTIQVVFSHDANLDAPLSQLEKGIVGTSLKPEEVRNDIKMARNKLSTGNTLFWVNQAVFYHAKSDSDAQNIVHLGFPHQSERYNPLKN